LASFASGDVAVNLFPVITGKTGTNPIFQGPADFDLELIEQRTLDSHTQELIYRPTPACLSPSMHSNASLWSRITALGNAATCRVGG
jgi:hypothetical protein